MVVLPAVADGFFDALSGRDILLALASDIVPTMTVNALSSLFRVTKKEKGFDCLVTHVLTLAGKDCKVELDQMLKISPMIGAKNDATRLFFLAHLPVVHEMERDCLKESGRKGEWLFEPNLREAVGCGTSELVSASCLHLPQRATRSKRQTLPLSSGRCKQILVPFSTHMLQTS
jgi:hypothetical protein